MIPAGEAKGTYKEEMHASFFRVGITNGTVVVIKVHVFPPQQISGIQSVLQ